MTRKCGHKGCLTSPSFGVVGSRKAGFCAKHASEGMVNVKNKKCGHKGCLTRPSFGVVGSRKAGFCAQHAAEGMVNVVNKKCGHEGCFTFPSFGVVGSRKAGFCAQHAAEGMVNVVNKKCGYEGCFTLPSFGVVGSRKAEFCAQHAAEGMVNVRKKRGDMSCLTASCDRKVEISVRHAETIVNVEYAGQPSSVVTVSMKSDLCAPMTSVGSSVKVSKRARLGYSVYEDGSVPVFASSLVKVEMAGI